MKTQKEDFTSKGKCDYCEKKGYSKDNCLKKNLICFNCDETGYLKPLCKSKSKNKSTSATSKEKRNIIYRIIILSIKYSDEKEY